MKHLALKLNDSLYIPVLYPSDITDENRSDMLANNSLLDLGNYFKEEDIICSNGDKFVFQQTYTYTSNTGYQKVNSYYFYKSGSSKYSDFYVSIEDTGYKGDYTIDDKNQIKCFGFVVSETSTTSLRARELYKKVWGYADSYSKPFASGDFTVTFSSELPVEMHDFKDPNYPPQDIGGSSGVGGNDGTLDDDTDTIPIPDLPNVSLCASGFIDMYVMSNVNLVQLNDALWSSTGEVIENLKKVFLDEPINGILSLALVPLNLTGVEKNVKIGNYDLGFTALRVSSEWAQLSCGTIHIAPYWGNSLDYSPFCKCQIYLPFCGTYEINVDDMMDKDVEVIYQCNVFNGACTAFITCDGSVKYSYSGNIVAQVPVSGKNSAELYKSIVGAISGVAIGSMSGMSGIALTGKAVSSGLSVLGNKGTIQRGGNVTGVNGMLAVKYPYLIFTRANQSRPDKFSSFKGYTSNITGIIAENSGYTEVAYCHVEIAGALEEDITEIENILKSGFII